MTGSGPDDWSGENFSEMGQQVFFFFGLHFLMRADALYDRRL